ncbi:MAG TPA: GldG family protein [Candidatus Binatia bacterium]|nr:GldG family protein [Candidatus Binatia bacterium]
MTYSTIDRSTRILPWLGLGLILVGAIITIITRRFDLLNNLLLGIGALILLIFAFLRPDSVREFVSGRQARYGTSTLLSVIFFAAIAILLYWMAYQNDDWRLDVTETGEFTPPEETVALLRSLDEPVHVIGFYTVDLGQQREEARTILESLAATSDQLTFEFQDPETNPLLAEKYELNFNGTLVFIKNQDQPDETFARANSLSDRDIHVALLKVANPVDKKLYILSGHGEPGIDSFAPEGIGTTVGLLEDQGFSVDSLNLFTSGAVPEDATVVAVIGPQAPLDEAEVTALRDYVENGGSLFVARDVIDSEGRAIAEDDGLNTYLQDTWGITLRNDVIIDQDLARAGQTFGLEFLAAQYGTSPIITSDLQEFGTRFSLARSIATGAPEGVTLTELVTTSPNAWGETDIATLSQQNAANPDEADAQGSLAIGVSGERAEGDARVVVFGDADFVTNGNLIWGGNSILFANALNWLADDEVAIELAPRETVQRQINIPEQQLRMLRFISTWFGPALMGIIGLVVWRSRRQRT